MRVSRKDRIFDLSERGVPLVRLLTVAQALGKEYKLYHDWVITHTVDLQVLVFAKNQREAFILLKDHFIKTVAPENSRTFRNEGPTLGNIELYKDDS